MRLVHSQDANPTLLVESLPLCWITQPPWLGRLVLFIPLPLRGASRADAVGVTTASDFKVRATDQAAVFDTLEVRTGYECMPASLKVSFQQQRTLLLLSIAFQTCTPVSKQPGGHMLKPFFFFHSRQTFFLLFKLIHWLVISSTVTEGNRQEHCQSIKRYIFARAYSILSFQKRLHIKKVEILSPAHTKKLRRWFKHCWRQFTFLYKWCHTFNMYFWCAYYPWFVSVSCQLNIL